MLYAIHRYPADLIDIVYLGDGGRVVVRPVLPQDADLTGAFFKGLSAPARYDRFMTNVRELPSSLLNRFTAVDYEHHLALVATTLVNGEESVIAEARYVLGEDPATAEFAVAVAEAWQGRGLAKLLLEKLACRAAASGVRRLTGETLASNARMLALARKAGFTLVPSVEVRGTLLLEKILPPTSARPCIAAAARPAAA